MEYVDCPVCGVHDEIDLWSKGDARYVRCMSCSLVYENPRFTETELRDFYSQESYFIQPNPNLPVPGYENYFTACTPKLQGEYFDIVEHYAGKRHGSFLDVGCGTGGVVKTALQRGWDAVGQEISRWAADQARKEGIAIVNERLLDARFPQERFDAISLFDVLEHLPSPRSDIREIFRILKPGGVVVIETPNIDGLFARYVYREKSELVKPRAHICLYGSKSVRTLLSDVPFSRVVIKRFPYCRRYSMAYFKGVIATRILRGRVPVQLTIDESLRIVCWK